WPRSWPSVRWSPCRQEKPASRSIPSTPSRGGENKMVCAFRRAWGRFWPFVRLAGTIPSIVEGNGMEGRSAAPAFSRFLSFFLPNHGIHDHGLHGRPHGRLL